MQYLDFEKTLMEVEAKIDALKVSQSQRGINITAEMDRLTQKRLRVMK